MSNPRDPDNMQPIKDFFSKAKVETDGLSLGDMAPQDYQRQLGRLFDVDHHGFLRLTQGGPVLAVSQKQVDAIIHTLQQLRTQVSP